MHPKVLIVGTVPYNVRSTSRAFDAYFHYWERENLAQVFSNPKRPCRGHCGTLYQITDHSILKKWLGNKEESGNIYSYDELNEAWVTAEYEVDSAAIKKAYRFGRKHSPLTHLLRGILWRKKYWCTEKLNQWMDAFQPECVFLAFSDDYFINRIALYVSERYDIPIVSCIGDDYYFNTRKTLNPLEHLYKSTYRALIRKVMRKTEGGVYISDKIRDKYNSEFGIRGDTVYLTSDVKRKLFTPINNTAPVITYFGNIRIGRWQSLLHIADALATINSQFRLEVYSNETNETYTESLKKHPNIIYGGAIPYQQVMERMRESDITVVVEGFDEKDVNMSRYSLSTKAADALASGAMVFAYGSEECGIIEYLKSTKAACVCTRRDQLKHCIEKLFVDQNSQKAMYQQAIDVSHAHHNILSSTQTFTNIVEEAVYAAKSKSGQDI